MSSITVIVPTYNVEQYIAKCLDSLVEQTFKDFEIWVISDGSTDNSSKIVKEYMNKDLRIHLIEKENGGYGSVLEYALKYIKSKYFLICDPDDWLEKDALLVLHSLAEKKKLDLVVGDKYEVFKNDPCKKYVNCFEKNLHIEPYKIYSRPEDVQRFSMGEVSPHAKLFKTELAKNITFPHHVSYTDTILYVVFLANAKRVVYINKPLADYFIDRPGNTMTNVRINKAFDSLTVWESIFNQIKNDKYHNATLLFYLYLLFMRNLSFKSNFKNNSLDMKILSELNEIRQFKKIINPYAMNKIQNIKRSIKSRITFKGLMNKNTSKITINIYVSLKSKKLV